MKVWVFVQRVNDKTGIEVFKTEMSARKAALLYVTSNWPQGVEMPKEADEAIALFHRLRSDIAFSIREKSVIAA